MNDPDKASAVLQQMKEHLHGRIDEWLGSDIPSEGDEDYDTWQDKIAEVDAIDSFDGLLIYLENETDDIADFFVCGDWDLSSLNLKPGDLPAEVISELGEVIASQSWRAGSWSTVYKYNDLYLAHDEVEGIVFDNAAEAFKRANIGRSTYDEILHMEVDPDYQHLIDNS